MKAQDAVSREVKRVALGTLALAAVMLIVFVAVGRMEARVLLGALYGCALAVGNFALLALTVRKIADDAGAVDDDATKLAKMRIQKSYSTRMLAGAVLLVVGVAVLKLNWLACCLPLVFPRIVILLKGLLDRAHRVKGSDMK